MSTSWVAGAVRARALARRRLGAAGARSLAARPSLAAAVGALADTPYGHDVRVGQDLADAQHALGAALLWNLRVLAGWLPRDGSTTVRVLGSWFELANVDERLALLDGAPDEQVYPLGALGTAWNRVAAAGTVGGTVDGVADMLAQSAWRVRDARTGPDIRIGLRLAWAEAVLSAVPEARAWTRGGAALLVLGELVGEGRVLSPANAARAARVLGPQAIAAIGPGADLAVVRRALPRDAAWVLEGVDTPGGLWRGDTSWWHRVERDGFELLDRPGFGPAPVVGAIAVLAADARRTRAALEAAARGGPEALEVFDAVA